MKLKKISYLVLSIAMVCSMLRINSVRVQAKDTVIHVSNYEELKAAVHDGGDQTTGRVIILDNDITNEGGLRFSMPTGREITITSANPASPYTIYGGEYYLCASGFDNSNSQGKVNLKNINLKADYGFWIYSGANISMDSVYITCTMPNASEQDPFSSYATLGIDYTSTHPNSIPSSVTIKNSVIDPSSIGAPNNGVDIRGNVDLTMIDCTILPGKNENTNSGYNSSGYGIGIRNADAHVTLTNTVVSGGENIRSYAAGEGIHLQDGTLTLTDSKVAGGADLEYGETALVNHNGIVTIHGGELVSGEDTYDREDRPRLIRKYNNDSKGTITVNPVLTFIDSKTVKMSPAIVGATVNFVDGSNALVKEDGLAKRTDGHSLLGEKAVLKEETITMLDSFPIDITAIESLPLSESKLAVTATATIPEPTYKVIIPEAISFDEQTQALSKYKDQQVDQYGNPIVVSKSFTVKAEGVDNLFDDLGKAPRVDVVIDFSGDMNGTKNQSIKIPYTVKKGDSPFTSGMVFSSFKNTSELAEGESNAVDGTVSINRTLITAADSYTGTMTFTIGIPAS